MIKAPYCLFAYNTNNEERYNPPRVANNTGIAVMTPYFAKVINPNFTPFFSVISMHIMPANAPIGVKYAPMLEPTIAA